MLDFPSIYLEYLIINHILLGKPKDANSLDDNIRHIFSSLATGILNPLHLRVVDPANSENILSDLLTSEEKNKIINVAKKFNQQTWGEVFY